VGPGSIHETGVVYEADGEWASLMDVPLFDRAWFPRTHRSVTQKQARSPKQGRPARNAPGRGLRATAALIQRLLLTPTTYPTLTSLQSETGGTPGVDDERVLVARAGCKARWLKELDRFERLWMLRGAFRQGSRAMAVLLYGYLLRRTGVNNQQTYRAAKHQGRQCVPPLPYSEIAHQFYSGAFGLRRNLRRQTINGWLGVTQEEREALDPDECARVRRAAERDYLWDAVCTAVRQHPEWSCRRVARELKERGYCVSASTVHRAKKRVAPDEDVRTESDRDDTATVNATAEGQGDEDACRPSVGRHIHSREAERWAGLPRTLRTLEGKVWLAYGIEGRKSRAWRTFEAAR
jgi:hypothetical protein